MNLTINPKVSVIVATYRRDRELRRALESLSNQSYPNYEIVLVDDNDHIKWNSVVEKLVEEFKTSHPDIEFVYVQNHPNLGSAKTRNVGVDHSKGQYICFLDDDDEYTMHKIANQVSFMVNNQIDYSITDLELFYDDGKFAEYRDRNYIDAFDANSLLKYHLMYHMTGTDTMMFTKGYFRAIGGFAPIDVGDEFYLMERAIINKGVFGYLPKCDVKAYIHRGDEGLSSGQSKINGENVLYEYKKKYFPMLDKPSVRYVKMRHHAVLAFAFLRLKKYALFLRESVIAFFVSPISCLKLLLSR